jgi:hypothetical protein
MSTWEAIMLVRSLVAVALLGLLAPAAYAGSFASAGARAETVGASCKKATVEITESEIVIECKKAGYARKLGDLTNLQWSISGGWGTMRAKEQNGDDFIVMVKKKEFPALKMALLGTLKGDKRNGDEAPSN